MTQAQNPKDDSRAAEEQAVMDKWNNSKPLFNTTVVMVDPSGEVTVNTRFDCAGHDTLDEAIHCMEHAAPRLRQRLEEERQNAVIVGRAIAEAVGVSFDPDKDFKKPMICVMRTDCKIVEFVS